MGGRLIDADALDIVYEDGDMTCVRNLGSTPTVDAVPVCRCRKCKYGITRHGITDGYVLCSKPHTERGNAMHRDDWFCADGERRSDGNET